MKSPGFAARPAMAFGSWPKATLNDEDSQPRNFFLFFLADEREESKCPRPLVKSEVVNLDGPKSELILHRTWPQDNVINF